MNYVIALLFVLAFVLHLIVAFGANHPRVNLTALAHAFLTAALGLTLLKLP